MWCVEDQGAGWELGRRGPKPEDSGPVPGSALGADCQTAGGVWRMDEEGGRGGGDPAGHSQEELEKLWVFLGVNSFSCWIGRLPFKSPGFQAAVFCLKVVVMSPSLRVFS